MLQPEMTWDVAPFACFSFVPRRKRAVWLAGPYPSLTPLCALPKAGSGHGWHGSRPGNNSGFIRQKLLNFRGKRPIMAKGEQPMLRGANSKHMKNQANTGAVMVVDDITDVHVAVSRVLQRAGYAVTCASDGEECLAHLRNGFRGLILMDIQMPSLDGWETIRKMVAEGLIAGNLICMLTTRPTPGEAAVGLEEYVFDYMPKPFEASQLLEVAKLASDYLRPPSGPPGAA